MWGSLISLLGGGTDPVYLSELWRGLPAGVWLASCSLGVCWSISSMRTPLFVCRALQSRRLSLSHFNYLTFLKNNARRPTGGGGGAGLESRWGWGCPGDRSGGKSSPVLFDKLRFPEWSGDNRPWSPGVSGRTRWLCRVFPDSPSYRWAQLMCAVESYCPANAALTGERRSSFTSCLMSVKWLRVSCVYFPEPPPRCFPRYLFLFCLLPVEAAVDGLAPAEGRV